MTKNRMNRTLVGMALSCSLAIASTGNAQTRVLTIQMDGRAYSGQVVMPLAQTASQHLGNGPIDTNNLPKDVLECDVCRQRLGLPPLKSLSSSMVPQPRTMSQQQNVLPSAGPVVAVPPQTGTIRMLGSPGMMSSQVAEQMAQQGFVVEEFKPPQPAPDAIQLGNIPPEVRQQFMHSLNLPQGARIMSAEVKGQSSSRQPTASDSHAALGDAARPIQNAIGTPGIGLPPEVVTPRSDSPVIEVDLSVLRSEPKQIPEIIPTPLATPSVAEQQPVPQPVPQVDAAAKEQQQLVQTIEELQKKLEQQAMEQTKLNTLLERMQSESQKQMERADAANRETLTMLEKRTAEVTELQLKLKSQRDAMEKMELRSKESDEKRHEPSKPEAKKKDSNKSKGKKPEKPSGNKV